MLVRTEPQRGQMQVGACWELTLSWEAEPKPTANWKQGEAVNQWARSVWTLLNRLFSRGDTEHNNSRCVCLGMCLIAHAFLLPVTIEASSVDAKSGLIKFTGCEPTACCWQLVVFESDGGIGGSRGSEKTKIWNLQGAETSPREESPVLMSSGEQRLIRTNWKNSVGNRSGFMALTPTESKRPGEKVAVWWETNQSFIGHYSTTDLLRIRSESGQTQRSHRCWRTIILWIDSSGFSLRRRRLLAAFISPAGKDSVVIVV